MNATQRLIKAVEEVFRLSQLDYDGIDILVQRSAANQEVKEAIAAAKEEQAKGSGLTVDEVMEALDNVGRHEGWGLVTVAKGALRKALEAHAENSSDNLRKG